MLNQLKTRKDKIINIDILKVKEIIQQKSKELKELLDLVVEDPSLSNNAKINIIINATALACAIIAIQPLPFADIFILSPIQVIMVTYLSKILGLNTDNTKAKELLVYLISTLGWGVLSQQAVIGLYKTILPYAGGFTTIPLVYASTFGLGISCKTLINAKLDNIEISKEQLKKIRQDVINKIKKEDRDWSPNNLKNQFKSIDRKEFKKYKEELLRFDEIINKNNSFSVKDINNKKICIGKRLSQYSRVSISDKVLYTISFMDSSKTIKEIEDTIAKIDRGEVELKFNYFKSQYYIKDLCELYITNKNDNYIIEDIKVVDNNLNYIISIFSNNNEIVHLKNEEIRKKFIYAIDSASYELNIASPWMNDYVVNDNLISKMENCLKKGATIKIVYGIRDNSNSYGSNRSSRSDEVANKLNERFRCYRDRFKIRKVNSHHKLLICDESFILEGSYNFLSFSGEYKDDVRSEGATYNTDLNVIRELRNLYFNF